MFLSCNGTLIKSGVGVRTQRLHGARERERERERERRRAREAGWEGNT
jgi:hypothetical protein